MPLSSATANLHRMAALFALLLLGFTAVMSWQSWQTSKDEQVLQLTTVLELVQKATDRYFLQTQAALEKLESDLRDGSELVSLPVAQRLLHQFQVRHPELTAVNLVALDGQFLATSTTTQLTGLPDTASQRDYPAIVAGLRPDKPLELSPPLLGPVSKRWILPLRYTVGGKQPLAFIVAAAPVELLQTFWSDAPIVQRASIALLGDGGYLLSRYPVPADASPADVYGKPRDGALWRHLQTKAFPQRGYIEGDNTLAAAEYGTVFMRLEHFPVTLAVAMPMAEFRAAWLRRARAPLALLLTLGLGAAIGYRVLLRRQRAWEAERAAADARLRDSEARLDRAGRLAQVGGWELALDKPVPIWSPQTRRIHEAPEDFQPDLAEAVAFYAPEGRARIEAAIAAGLRDGTPWDLELPLTTARGRSIWVRSIGEVESQDGRPQRLVGAFQDITDYRQRLVELQQEQALRLQAEQHARELDALLHERSEMLDVLAHEVRQPLHNASAALQSAGSVLADIGEQAAASRLQRARSVMSQVLSSIDNTLAVAALLARPGPIALEDTDIDTLVEVVVGDLPAEQRGRVRIERLGATRTALMDMSLVRLALRNLVLNALKHSSEASAVTVRLTDSDEPLALLIDVVDAGSGIAPEILPRLFERGARAAGSGGHGLGLYIVRRVMELHGGSVLLLHDAPGGVTMRLVFAQVPDA